MSDVTVVTPGRTAWDALLRAYVTTVEYCEANGHTYGLPQPVEGVDTDIGVDVLECNCCGKVLSDLKVAWFRRPATDPVPTTDPERA